MTRIIRFNKPIILRNWDKYIKRALQSGKLAGDHDYTRKCNRWIEKKTKTRKAFLTTSCTHALEMAALLINIRPEDEIIMPSFTFPSTANAFILRGAKIVFVDIRPDTMNIDEKLVEGAITRKTKAIVPVHYAGVGCEMDTLLRIAETHKLFVIEDAAQSVLSTYRNQFLGTLGHFGTYSFHETKNYTCGEGGAILINRTSFIRRAEIIREKGTNRSSFFRGEVDKYRWIDVGSSYLPSELNAAFLYAQLEIAEEIKADRMRTWRLYDQLLKSLENCGNLELPKLPKECRHNGHLFYIKTGNLGERTKLLDYLKGKGINAMFHYIPLHTAKAGRKFGRFSGIDRFTTRESERLIRLPLYYGMSKTDTELIFRKIKAFYD
jgi:dTDP-4-amino-4,6-dideoxygalactose transaminase